ncbi:MAG: aminopeptidase P family protein [Labrys sp. (in: a-proteobacteria)]
MTRKRLQSFNELANPAQGAPRIAKLRQKLAAMGLTGFVVPRSDSHQNEYVPASEERLAWLTGFTGSAGAAVILIDRAAIFVDGRYTVQVREQVDTALLDPQHLVENPPEAWLGTVLTAKDRLGFDAALHTIAEVEKLKGACERTGAALVPVEDNPIDAIWTDRPAAPMALVTLHDEALAGESAASKLARLQGKLGELRADALFTADAHAVAWMFNIRGGDVDHTPLPLSFAYLPREGQPILFIDGRKLSNTVRDALSGLASVQEPSRISAELARLGAGKTVRVDPNGTVQRFAEALTAGGATLQRGADTVALLRAVKNAAEQAGTRAAHIRDGAAMARFLAWFDREAPKGGLTEVSVAQALEDFRAETGSLKDLSFPSISAAGPNAAIPHYRVTEGSNRPVTPGLFLIDSGAQYVDGTTDITRTIAVGETSALMRDRYTRVLKGMIAVSLARFPKGASGAQLDSFARRALWEIGTDYDHGTGHGVGSYLSVHEGPQRISKLGHTTLEPGMILSNEPGYYRAGDFGIRIENLIIVQKDEREGDERPIFAFETITLAPIDKRPIETSLLTTDEKAWLNAYHARVEATLAPLVDDATRAYLKKACAPL